MFMMSVGRSIRLREGTGAVLAGYIDRGFYVAPYSSGIPSEGIGTVRLC
jgi:hypothetical protein